MDGDSSDLNGLELAEEISFACSILNKKHSPVEILKLITELKCAPNLKVALRILLTLPVTVASGERSFSKLELLIKNFLRSTMAQTDYVILPF